MTLQEELIAMSSKAHGHDRHNLTHARVLRIDSTTPVACTERTCPMMPALLQSEPLLPTAILLASAMWMHADLRMGLFKNLLFHRTICSIE